MNEHRILNKDLIGFGLIGLFVFLFFYIDGSTFSIPIEGQKFFSLFIGIVLKALPFLFLTVFLSVSIQKIVTVRTILHLTPKHPIIAVLLLVLLGATSGNSFISVLLNFMKNGMPTFIGISLLMGTQLINPVVLFTTYIAFQTTPAIVYARIGIGLLLCIFIGIIVFLLFHKKVVLKEVIPVNSTCISNQTSNEFFELGKYLITGAMIVSLLLTFLEQDFLAIVGSNELLSSALLMLLSFMMSISPAVDSLVVAPFEHTFSIASILSFLLFGSILNVNSIKILLAYFHLRFVTYLVVIVSLSTYCFILLFEAFY